MRFGILGPVEIRHAGSSLRLPRAQNRGLLAYLLLNANRVVSLDNVFDALWGGAEPATARSQVHSAIHAIRRQLREAGDEAALVSRAGGYVLNVETEQLDAALFQSQVGRARSERDAGRPAEARALLREALELWRGPALSDATGAFVEAARARLGDQQLTAYEDLTEVELALGRHTDVIAEFGPLLDEHPLRERLRGQVMLALYRCGRQVEALQSYQELRKALADEQGLDPGQQLRDLERAILRADPSLDPRPPAATVVGSGQAPAPAPEAPPTSPARPPAETVEPAVERLEPPPGVDAEDWIWSREYAVARSTQAPPAPDDAVAGSDTDADIDVEADADTEGADKSRPAGPTGPARPAAVSVTLSHRSSTLWEPQRKRVASPLDAGTPEGGPSRRLAAASGKARLGLATAGALVLALVAWLAVTRPFADEEPPPAESTVAVSILNDGPDGEGPVHVLEVADFDVHDGARVHLWSRRSDASMNVRPQVWQPVQDGRTKDGSSQLRFKNVNSSTVGRAKCLDRGRGHSSDSLVQFECSEARSQLWYFDDKGRMRNVDDDKCVEIEGGELQEGATVRVANCTADWTQQWRYEERTDWN
jgi:DNA-binding SARP family transcriptional activator